MLSDNEVNKKIATSIFKMVVVVEGNEEMVVRKKDGAKSKLPRYTSSTDAAYAVVRWFKTKKFEVQMGYLIEDDKVSWYTYYVRKGRKFGVERASTLARAICLGALNWVENRGAPGNTPSGGLISVDFPKKPDE